MKEEMGTGFIDTADIKKDRDRDIKKSLKSLQRGLQVGGIPSEIIDIVFLNIETVYNIGYLSGSIRKSESVRELIAKNFKPDKKK